MTDDPFLQLVCDGLELMHRPFTNRRSEWSLTLEFYHQFRKLWDRGIPVGMGLGHLLLRPAVPPDLGEPTDTPGLMPLLVDRVGEHGRSDERLAVIQFCTIPGLVNDRFAAVSLRAGEATANRGVLVVVGTTDELADADMTLTDPDAVIRFDTDRWTARVG